LLLVFAIPAYVWFICKMICMMSGWNVLARRFTYEGSFEPRWKWRSARMRMYARYNHAINFGADDLGLYMRTVAILPAHPPLMIPWNEIRYVSESKILYWKFVTLSLGTTENIPFTIFEELYKEIQARSARPTPIPATH
jgi:hypothetical protein